MKAAFVNSCQEDTHAGHKLQQRQAHSMLTKGTSPHPLRRPSRPRRLQAFYKYFCFHLAVGLTRKFVKFPFFKTDAFSLHGSTKAKIP